MSIQRKWDFPETFLIFKDLLDTRNYKSINELTESELSNAIHAFVIDCIKFDADIIGEWFHKTPFIKFRALLMECILGSQLRIDSVELCNAIRDSEKNLLGEIFDEAAEELNSERFEMLPFDKQLLANGAY